jgi:hypothetical protein
VGTSDPHAQGLTESVRQRLRGMDGYSLKVLKLGGEHVWQMRGAGGDLWVLWVSDRYLAKIGAPEGEEDVPQAVVEAYLSLYPSDLDAQGKAKPVDHSASAGSAG